MRSRTLVVVAALILTGFGIEYRRRFHPLWQPPPHLQLREPGRWRLTTSTSVTIEAEQQHAIVFYRLVVLYLRTETGERMTLIIPQDSLPADQHRRLRAHLRLNE